VGEAEGGRGQAPVNRGQLTLFVVAVFLLWFSQYVFLPTLPRYLTGKVASLSLAGVVLSMYGLWQLAVRLPVGLAVDRIGREKLFVMIGYLLSAAGTLFLAATAAVAVGAVFLLPVPMVGRRSESRPVRPLLGLFLRCDVILPSLLGALNQFMVFGVSLGFMPILAARLGASDVTVGLLASVNLLVFLGGNLASAVLSRRVRPATLLLAAYALFAAAAAGAAAARSVPALLLIQGGLGLAHGIGYPTLMGLSIRYVPLGSRTTAMGIHQSVYSAGIFLGPWVCGLLAANIGLRPMFALNAAACLALGCAGTALVARRFTPPRAGGNAPTQRHRPLRAG
jgi:MFS family permease